MWTGLPNKKGQEESLLALALPCDVYWLPEAFATDEAVFGTLR